MGMKSKGTVHRAYADEIQQDAIEAAFQGRARRDLISYHQYSHLLLGEKAAEQLGERQSHLVGCPSSLPLLTSKSFVRRD